MVRQDTISPPGKLSASIKKNCFICASSKNWNTASAIINTPFSVLMSLHQLGSRRDFATYVTLSGSGKNCLLTSIAAGEAQGHTSESARYRPGKTLHQALRQDSPPTHVRVLSDVRFFILSSNCFAIRATKPNIGSKIALANDIKRYCYERHIAR